MVVWFFRLVVLLFVCQIYTFASNIQINTKNLKLSDLVRITSKAINKTILMPEPLDSFVFFSTNEDINQNDLQTILKYSLEQKGYELIKDKEILKIVRKRVELKQNISDINQTTIKQQSNIELKADDVYTKIIYLKHSSASNIKKVLKPLSTKTKIPNIKNKYQIFQNKILNDDITNSIIIVGQKKFVLTIANIVKNIDIAQYQVYVKTKIVQISQQKAKNIGIKYGLIGANSNSAGLRTYAANLGGKYKTFDMSDTPFETTSLSKGFLIGATINLLNSNGALDIISQPSLLCVNNQKSSIYIGQTKSIQEDIKIVKDGTTIDKSFTRENIGLKFSVVPRVLDDKRVVLGIEASLEDINGATTNGQPDTTKKTISTTAIVNSASSVILGGLIGQKNEIIKTKVPFWGDIPFLGALFKNEKTTNEKTTLAIIVTPYIVPKNKTLSYITDKLSSLELIEQQYIKRLDMRIKNQNK
ncbi:MAG: hypothetical protein DRG11_05375 [Epsilonproteobacteria bacterium]|nr:MAG: hypothetical protein DRG11_05375 [Campylobacterota bacterium]